jgi:hypothetical protein
VDDTIVGTAGAPNGVNGNAVDEANIDDDDGNGCGVSAGDDARDDDVDVIANDCIDGDAVTIELLCTPLVVPLPLLLLPLVEGVAGID